MWCRQFQRLRLPLQLYFFYFLTYNTGCGLLFCDYNVMNMALSKSGSIVLTNLALLLRSSIVSAPRYPIPAFRPPSILNKVLSYSSAVRYSSNDAFRCRSHHHHDLSDSICRCFPFSLLQQIPFPCGNIFSSPER